jgi:hypothetical protein
MAGGMQPGQTRADKNFNPGNIMYGPFAKSSGATGSAGMDEGHGVAAYPSYQAGFDALNKLVGGKGYAGQGRNTLDSIMSKYSPSNPQAAGNIGRSMGVKPGDRLDFSNPQTRQAFDKALARQEGAPGAVKWLDSQGGGKTLQAGSGDPSSPASGGGHPMQLPHPMLAGFMSGLTPGRGGQLGPYRPGAASGTGPGMQRAEPQKLEPPGPASSRASGAPTGRASPLGGTIPTALQFIKDAKARQQRATKPGSNLKPPSAANLKAARDAIGRGAKREDVMERLEENGFSSEGL